MISGNSKHHDPIAGSQGVWLTVDPAQCGHKLNARAFRYKSQQQVLRAIVVLGRGRAAACGSLRHAYARSKKMLAAAKYKSGTLPTLYPVAPLWLARPVVPGMP